MSQIGQVACCRGRIVRVAEIAGEAGVTETAIVAVREAVATVVAGEAVGERSIPVLVWVVVVLICMSLPRHSIVAEAAVANKLASAARTKRLLLVTITRYERILLLVTIARSERLLRWRIARAVLMIIGAGTERCLLMIAARTAILMII